MCKSKKKEPDYWVNFYEKAVSKDLVIKGYKYQLVAYGPTDVYIGRSYPRHYYWYVFWKNKDRRPDRRKIVQLLDDKNIDFVSPSFMYFLSDN